MMAAAVGVVAVVLVLFRRFARKKVLEGGAAAVRLGLVQPFEVAVEGVVREVGVVRPVAAELLDGIAHLHILVVIELILLRKTFEDVYGALVAVAAEQAGKERDVLAAVETAHQPHIHGGVALVAREDLDEHLVGVALGGVELLEHLVHDLVAVLEEILIRLQPFLVGQALVREQGEHLKHLFFSLHSHRRLRRRSSCICSRTFR